jgi:hypothetical protein
MRIPGRQDPKANIFKLVHDWLCDGKRRWILFLDNVDDTTFLLEPRPGGQSQTAESADTSTPLREYIPQSESGSILITTRSKDAALDLVEEGDIIAIEPMNMGDARNLFEKKLGKLGQVEEVADLVKVLEFMPLAIVQAAAYISQRVPRYSVQQYLAEFQKSDHKKKWLLNHEGGKLRRDREAKNSIIITWQISFDYIRHTRPSATDLLSLMSFFGSTRYSRFIAAT